MLTIDRFEGPFALCETEDGTMVSVPKNMLPAGCCEGDALRLEDGSYVKDNQQQRRRKMQEKMQGLFKRK